MASYNPPTELITQFNSSLFNQPEETLSQAEADTLYLSKKKNDISTAPLTTFNGQISVGGSADFNSTVSLKNRYRIMELLNITSDTTITLSVPLFQTYVIRTTSVPTTALTINLPAIQPTDIGLIVNFVKFKGTNNLAVTFNGGAWNIIPLNQIATLGASTNTSLLSVDKQMTTLMVAYTAPSSYYWLEVSNYSTFDRDYNNSIYPKLAASNTFTGTLNTNTFSGALNSGTSGVSTSGAYFKAGATMYDISSPYTTFLQLYPSGSGMQYIMNNAGTNIATSHNFKTYDTSNIQTTPFYITSATTTIANTLTATTSNFSGVLTMLSGTPITLKDTANINYVDMKCVSTGYQVNNPSASGSATFNFNSVPAVEITSASTRIYKSIDVGTQGVVNLSSFRSPIQLYDIQSPYTNRNEIYTNYSNALYNMIGTSTNHRFACANSSSNLVTCLDLYSDQNISRVPLTLTEGLLTPQSQITQSGDDLIINNAQTAGATTIKFRFNNVTSIETSSSQFTTYLPIRLAKPTYTFPLTQATHQGYYLKTTGIAQAVVSATPKTILTTPSIAIGVWRIDFSVINTVTTGGNITQSQNFISTTNNGAVATAVDFTGSTLRSHTTENYATGDVQEIAGSFTYNQSTAGVLYLNILRTFSTGVYSFVGEVSITRLA